jgi:membrane protein implicated in regulation of membrane protease activity
MNDITWILWAVLGAILIVAEIFTPGFVLLWFGIGAFVSSFIAILGIGYPFQFLAFFFVSILLTVLSRTLFLNYFPTMAKKSGLKMGIDALPGKIGIVVSSSQGALNEAAVKIQGSIWTAYPTQGETPLEVGSRVVVEKVQGASLYVRHADAIPEWRMKELPPKE